jgi:hypothetical protein
MYLEELIEVAIGLIFVWLIMSMAALQVQEVIASLTKKRARDLSGAIRDIVGNETLFKEFYAHPLLKNIKVPANGSWDRLKRWVVGLFGRKIPEFEDPAYIPASTFATIIFDLVAKAGTPDSLIQKTFSDLQREVGKLKAGHQSTANALLGRIADLGWALSGSNTEDLKARLRTEIEARLAELGGIEVDGETPLAALTTDLTTALNQGSSDFATLLTGAEPYINKIRRGAMQSSSIALGKTLNSLLTGVEDYATGADKAIAIGRKNVESWFDNSMDRLSSWYKRWSQAWILFIGFVLALLLNVDSMALANHLWREPAVRQALAANATSFVEANPDLPPGEEASLPDVVRDLRERFDGLSLPVGWIFESKPALRDADGKPKTSADGTGLLCPHPEEYATFDKNAGQLFKTVRDRCVLYSNLPNTLGEGGRKLAGIFLTALATLQGAPLWFDLLKKLINVRNTGINPAEKPKISKSDTEG